MDAIQFVPLFQVEKKCVIDLMNNKKVARYLPLLKRTFTDEDCEDFIRAKKNLWDEHGFGPWAFIIHNEFAGWGGLQPEQADVDFALVLHPNYWGWGIKIFNQVKHQALHQMGLDSFTILLPPNRANSNAVKRFGFFYDGQLEINNTLFSRFRIFKSKELSEVPALLDN